jgi:hypothetical protein
MPTTVTSNGARRATTAAPPAPPAPTSAAQRNRSRVAAGGLVLTVCTLAAVLIYGRVGDRREVLAMARTVEIGQVVQPSDVRVVRVSSDPGVHTVRATDRVRIVGRPAAVRLLAGSMLSADQIGEAAGLPAGTALVGAVLKAGQFPLGLAPGDTVGLVVSSSMGVTAGVTADAAQTTPPVATVVGVEPAADATGNTAASLQVPVAIAPAIAEAGAAGRLNLVVMGR